MNQKKNYGIDRDALCPMRRMVVDAANGKNLSLAELSRIAGKSDGYMHSFITRSIPKYLHDATRTNVAQALGIDELELMDPADREKLPAFTALTLGKVSPGPASAPVFGEIPMYRDTDDTSAAPTGFATRPGAGADATQIVALWITRPCGRLRAGDIAYADRSRSPRNGDTAVVVQDGNIIGIGDYHEGPEGTASVGECLTFNASEHDLWKIRWIETP